MGKDMVIYKTPTTAADDEETIGLLNAIQSACDELRRKNIRSAAVLKRIGQLDLKLMRRTIQRIRRTKKRYVVRSIPSQPQDLLAEHVQKRMDDFMCAFGQRPKPSNVFEGLDSLVDTGHRADSNQAEALEVTKPFLVVYRNKDGDIESKVCQVSQAISSGTDVSPMEHEFFKAGIAVPKRQWTLRLSTNNGVIALFDEDDVVACGWVKPGNMVCFRQENRE